MSDNQITVYGNVGTEVDCRDSNGFQWAMFRLGSTPRSYDRQRGWQDLETVWFTVKVIRQLAKNVATSLQVGDPVVAIGRIRTHVWEDEDTKEVHRRAVLEATSVSHDLSRGTTRYTRNDTDAVAAPVSDTASLRDFERKNQVSQLTA